MSDPIPEVNTVHLPLDERRQLLKLIERAGTPVDRITDATPLDVSKLSAEKCSHSTTS